jgi:CDP-diglyceride synthetase
MIFHDLFQRGITAIILLATSAAWLTASYYFPHVFLLGLGILMLICLYEWLEMSKNRTGTGGLKYCGIAGIVGGFLAWIYIHQTMGLFGTCLILAVAMTSDTLAYLGGRLFGGPKLCPKISPSKTWAGCLSSLILAPLCAAGLLHMIHQGGFSWFNWRILTALALAGQIGDLVESAAKRLFQVKDSGTWLPGHGGFLDRLDSILAMAFALAVFLWMSS